MTRPSPFAGMDPFLEHPNLWASIHTRLIVALSQQLADQLAPHFYVAIEQRVYNISPDEPAYRQPIVPDVNLVSAPCSSGMTTPTGAIAPSVVVEPLYDLEIQERYLEIRDMHSHEVVTVIELLSPFNKAAVSPEFDAFRHKRQAVMGSRTHWLEIDLLRGGRRPPEVEGESDYRPKPPGPATKSPPGVKRAPKRSTIG